MLVRTAKYDSDVPHVDIGSSLQSFEYADNAHVDDEAVPDVCIELVASSSGECLGLDDNHHDDGVVPAACIALNASSPSVTPGCSGNGFSGVRAPAAPSGRERKEHDKCKTAML